LYRRMDDGKVMLLGLGATAIAGFAALAYAASTQQEQPAEPVKPRRNRKPRVEEDAVASSGEASGDNEDGAAGAADAGASPKKNKRKHKGRRKKKSAKRAEDEAKRVAADDGLGARMFKDDGKNTNSWETKKAKESKPKPSKKEAAEADKSAAGPPKTFVTMKLGSKVGAVVGKGGRKINQIQDDTGARLSIEKGDKTLTISGTKDQVAEAKAMVDEAIADRKDSRQDFTGPSVTIDLGKRAGAVIGRGGSTIKMIESETSANLDIKNRDADSARLIIRGPDQESVDAAEKMVNDILSNDNGPRSSADDVTMDLGSRHGMFTILGSGGSQIRELQEKSGARLNLDKEAYTVSIGGSEEQVETARGLISALLSASSTSESITLTSKTVGAVIGKQGATIRRIQKETNAHLDIKRDSDPITLKIMGTAEQVAAAKAMVEAVLAAPPAARAQKPLGPGETEFTINLGRAVGSVIGKGGSNIQRLQEETGARLEIARDSSDCRIVGKKESVAKAREEVEAIVKRVTELDAKKAEKAAKIAAAGLTVPEVSKETFAGKDGAAADGEGDWGSAPAGW